MRVKELKWVYDTVNRLYFDNKLPDIPVTFGHLPGTTNARTAYRFSTALRKWHAYKIVVNRRLNKPWLEKTIGMCMLHEMVHTKLGIKPSCEVWSGPFDKEMTRLAKAGAMCGYW